MRSTSRLTGAGVRIGEAISLRVNDVEARDRSPRLRVYGTGGRRRVVPVGPEVIEAVDAYLISRQDRLGSHRATDELFVRADGRPFTRGTLDYLVSTWFRRAGAAPPPGSLAHALRHTYATLLVDNGASLPELQRLLGHRDLSTTQVYLAVTGSGLEQTAMANPARALLRKPLPHPRSTRSLQSNELPPRARVRPLALLSFIASQHLLSSAGLSPLGPSATRMRRRAHRRRACRDRLIRRHCQESWPRRRPRPDGRARTTLARPVQPLCHRTSEPAVCHSAGTGRSAPSRPGAAQHGG